MPTIQLPIEWARGAGGLRRVGVEGQTVAECLAALRDRFPELGSRLDSHFEVFVNWESARLREGAATGVAPADTIQIVPLRA